MKHNIKHVAIIATMLACIIITAGIIPVSGDNTLVVTGEVVINPGPVADFTATPTDGTSPLRVRFKDQSSGKPKSWAWDFDNDGIIDSTAKNPTYIYRTAGTYSVRLTVTSNEGSDSETKFNYITVTTPVHPPVALFTQNKYFGRAPLTVKFTDRSLYNPTRYSWNFGDGSTSGEQNPRHTYTRNGLYIVRLTVTNDGGSDTTYGAVLVFR